jgi:hypothetical protein
MPNLVKNGAVVLNEVQINLSRAYLLTPTTLRSSTLSSGEPGKRVKLQKK